MYVVPVLALIFNTSVSHLDPRWCALACFADCVVDHQVGPDVIAREFAYTEYEEDEIFLALDKGYIDCHGGIKASGVNGYTETAIGLLSQVMLKTT